MEGTYRRVGTVRADRNETDITVTLATGLVVRLNDGQTSVFTGSSRVGLERAGVEAGDLAQVLREFLHQVSSCSCGTIFPNRPSRSASTQRPGR